MVAHFTMHTYGVKQGFRFVEGIWLHPKSSENRFFFGKKPILHHTCATCSRLPSCIIIIFQQNSDLIQQQLLDHFYVNIMFEIYSLHGFYMRWLLISRCARMM